MKETKDVTALVIDYGLFCETAARLGRDFKKVYYYVPQEASYPLPYPAHVGYGIDGLELVDSPFGPWYKDVDVFIFTELGFPHLQTFLESQGKLVWGARQAEELESNRAGMRKLMKKLGLAVADFHEIKGLDALREYLKYNKNQWVKINRWRGVGETFFAKEYKLVEAKLDEMQHSLGPLKNLMTFICEENLPDRIEAAIDGYTVDGKYPDKILTGIEVKDKSFAGRVMDFDKIPEQITRFDKTIAPVLGRYGYRGFYGTEVRIGKDLNPYMTDFCFDDQTEVLSERGWIPFRDCNLTDRLATLNTLNRQIEYQMPERLISYLHEGDMIRMTNPKGTIDALITPNHQVLRTDRHKNRLFKEDADKLTDKGFIPRTGIWSPLVTITHFVLPEYHHEWDFIGKHGEKICRRIKHESAVKIPMADWAAFMAWYLSEGSTSTSSVGREGVRYSVNISQTTHPEIVRKVLEKLPFKFNYNGKAFRISSAQLAEYLHSFGLCADKFVPDYIKQAGVDVIRVFLDNYSLGDGGFHKGNKNYSTTSKRIADDLQELIFKVGSVANICTNPTKGTQVTIAGKTYTRNYDVLTLIEHQGFFDYWFETQARKDRYITSIPYNGQVYCATVPNGTLYVRRHGKPFWSGNCARSGSPPGELWSEMYTNLGDIVWHGANGEMVNPVIKDEWGVQVFIESQWSDHNWQAIYFPEKYRKNIKLRNVCKVDGRYYIIPQHMGITSFGTILGMGKTLEAATAQAKEIAETVEGDQIDITATEIDEAIDQLKKMESFGMSIFK